MSADSIIPIAATPPQAVSRAQLNADGVALLQRLAGATWTDYNAHDPGITILEQLSYVLTDLAYRAGYRIPDLLVESATASQSASLFTPAQILTSNPVTIDDWRKLVIDVQGVRNAWVEVVPSPQPQLFHDPGDNTLYFDQKDQRTAVSLRGVSQVLVDADPNAVMADSDVRNAVDARVRAHRNLGEDFQPAVILGRQPITISAELEVGEVRDSGAMLQTIYAALQDHFAPRPRFYTLEEMLARGRTLDEIFDGPRLNQGFIDTEELRQCTRPDSLRTSDIIGVLMGIAGIRDVHDVLLGAGSQQEAWYLPLTPMQTPVLDVAGSSLRFRRGHAVWTPTAGFQAAPPATKRARPIAVEPAALLGRNRHIGRYHSVQYHLPEVFGVGPSGLPAAASPERRAQARQLAGYLLLYDQILANSFSQLAHVRDLFSFEPGLTKSYFSQLPDDVPRAAEVLDPNLDASALQSLVEDPLTVPARQQSFLDHFLARFAEEFGDTSLLSDTMQRTPAQSLEAQGEFLREYPAVSGGRARAFDYTRPSWGPEHAANVSGLEKRVACKLGLTGYCRRPLKDLAANDPGGFHLVENILLRPCQADADQWTIGGDLGWRPPAFLTGSRRLDPYSAQLTFVFPDWVTAFGGGLPDDQKNTTRDYILKTIREEAPAHLTIDVLWSNQADLAVFEAAYQTWLASMVTQP